MSEPIYIDVQVVCGNACRYYSRQTIAASGKEASDIQIGDVLPDLRLPNVEAPCFCSVVKKIGIYA